MLIALIDNPGRAIDMEDGSALRLIRDGLAVPYVRGERIETATQIQTNSTTTIKGQQYGGNTYQVGNAGSGRTDRKHNARK